MMVDGSAIAPLPAAAILAAGTFLGKAAFAGLYLILAGGLALVPRRWLGQEGAAPPPWRNVRYWAIAIALVQFLVYAVLG